jgi:hypothetical protein
VNPGPAAASMRVNHQHASQFLHRPRCLLAIPTAGIVTRSAGVNPARGEVLIRGEVVRRDASALMIVSTGRGIPAENFTLEPAAIPQQLHPNRSLRNLSSDLCMRWLMFGYRGDGNFQNTKSAHSPRGCARDCGDILVRGVAMR